MKSARSVQKSLNAAARHSSRCCGSRSRSRCTRTCSCRSAIAFERLKDRERDIYRGELAAMAMNEPKLIADERTDVLAAMKKPAVAAARRAAADELRAAGEALVARIETGRVLEDKE
jgi:hypothetical protein